MVNYYEILGLNNDASLDEIKKSWRDLAKKYHPDLSKNSKSADKFIEIAEAYEILCNKKNDSSHLFTDFTTSPGKVIITHSNSFVEINYGNNSLSGNFKRSENNRFFVIFSDGYFQGYQPTKWINGKICLIEDDNLLWIKEIPRPTNTAVSNIGRLALLYTTYHDDSSSSRPREFIELGGMLSVIEKSGNTLFSYEFGSNIEGCSISQNGEFVVVSTLYPDNSIYFFDMQKLALLWKYKSHLRKEPILELKILENQIDVFVGSTIATAKKAYELNFDGTLTPKYQEKVDDLKKIKKQKPQEKTESLLVMINSNDKRDVKDGFLELTAFVKTKGSVPYHDIIVNNMGSLLQQKSKLFEDIWKVTRQILKSQPEKVEPIVPFIISQAKLSSNYDNTWLLSILGELGGANSSWIKNEEQFIKQNLKSKLWNERRFAAFAIGSIGSVDPSFVKDVIPILVEYVSNPEKVRKELDEIALENSVTNTYDGIPIPMNISGIDGEIWLRDASIDALGMIGERYPDYVSAAIPILEKLSKNAPSPFTVKKAINALSNIIGKK